MSKAAIIGTTTWGITLGMVLARKGTQVRLWARTEEETITLKTTGPTPPLPKGVSFPPQLSITSSLDEAMAYVDMVILAVPSQTMRQNMKLVAPHLKKSMILVSAAKGLEIGSGKRMSQVIAEETEHRSNSHTCVLSGPNLSREVMLDLPAASVVAAGDEAIARKIQKLLNTPNFSVYTNSDVIGVELGGALKNIIALGAGMVDGLGYGDNAKAAFITRGLTEITALGMALGASPLTFSGLAGLGDLVATCASPLSRNHYVGMQLTKGRELNDITESMDGVAEGVTTTLAVWNLAQQLELEMPITEKIYEVLYQGADAKQAIIALLGASGRHELAGRKWRLFSLFRHHG